MLPTLIPVTFKPWLCMLNIANSFEFKFQINLDIEIFVTSAVSTWTGSVIVLNIACKNYHYFIRSGNIKWS